MDTDFDVGSPSGSAYADSDLEEVLDSVTRDAAGHKTRAPEIINVDELDEDITPASNALSRSSSQDYGYSDIANESFFGISTQELISSKVMPIPSSSNTSSRTTSSATATEPASSGTVSETSSARSFERTVSDPSTSTSAPQTTLSKSKSFGGATTTAAEAGPSRQRTVSEPSSVLGKRKAREPPSGLPETRSIRKKRLPSWLEEKASTGKPVIISHSTHYQRLFDARKLPVGVQWEIARFLTLQEAVDSEPRTGTKRCDRYGSIEIEWLDNLQRRSCDKESEKSDSNAHIAPKVASFLAERILGKESLKAFERDELYNTAFATEMAAKAPWEELDREAAALKNNPYGALGLDDIEDWYGGKVHFVGKLKEDGYIILERPELGPSCRFARRFGSHRFLRIKVPKKLLSPELRDYFKRPFVINGRVYRAFYAKDCTVFLFQTDEVVSADEQRVSLPKKDGWTVSRFIDWHNPILQNQFQTAAKWAARMALGLSNSVPGVRLPKENITRIHEIISEAWPTYQKDHPEEKKPPSFMEMTDGCGWINRTGLIMLRRRVGWESTPTAIQCRVAGAKGLLLLHPDDKVNADPVPKIWIRPSQEKIKYGDEQMSDFALSTIDVLRASHMKSPSRLSAEVIINLSENGVPHKVFVNLMAEGLKDIVTGLTDWSEPDGVYNVYHALTGSVIAARLARAAQGEARARGFRERDEDSDEEEDEDELIDMDAAIHGRSSAWWMDQISGCPSSLEETAMVLIDAGFRPETCFVLREKLRQVVKKKINTYVTKYNFVLPMSCSAFIVPDPYDVLAAGEIQIRCSHRCLKPADGSDELVDFITGDVLVTRNPCKLPTDVQKVKAVVHERLRDYTDVIVFSVAGNRHLASKLGGGDYDGDKVLAMWQPDIVGSFINADDRHLDPPPELDEWIGKDPTRVSDVVRGKDGSAHDFIDAQQTFLLMGLKTQPLVGLYSVWHDQAVYTKGYTDLLATQMGHMAGIVLDAPKTGLEVKEDAFRRHQKQFAQRQPRWKESQKDAKKFESTNEVHPVRRTGGPEGLEKFVMDTILEAANKERDNWLATLQDILPDTTTTDKDLEAPWQEAQLRARKCSGKGYHDLEQDLELIKQHVQNLGQERQNMLKREKGKSKESFTDLDIEDRQDILRELSRKFACGLTVDSMNVISRTELEDLKASYAYSWAKYGRFPFDVATRTLCAIKARSLGPYKVVTQNFYERFKLHKAFLQNKARS